MFCQNVLKNNLFIFTCILTVFLSIFLYKYYYTSSYLTIKEIKNSYDYIIVGAGTCGCVLASKLSENLNKSVLLIEAGNEFNYLSTIPLLSVLLQGTEYDWAYKSAPQKFSSFGLHDQVQFLPRGKGVGGSNQINYMVHSDDVDNNLEEIFNWNKSSFNLSFTNNELSNLLKHSSKELNQSGSLKFIPGINSIYEGRRWTSFHSHLKPIIKRENLDVAINSRGSKIIFNDNKAVALEIKDEKNKRIVLVRNEIILSAGVFNTPQILILSGIGPSNLLKQLKISQVVDLPGVGKNLHDHLNMPLFVKIEKPISLTMNKVLKVSEIYNYLFYKQGLLAKSPNAGYIRKNNISVLLFGMGSTDEKIFRDIANIKPEIFREMFPHYKNASQEGFVLLSTCLKPLSRGFVILKNKNFQKPPLINPKYLSKNVDIKCMINAVRLAENIINTSVFKKIGAKIHWPKFENCKKNISKKLIEKNDEYLECIIRTVSLTGYHPGGTCKLGESEERFTVVDKLLKVKGIKNLRIMDASILPEPLTTYPNSILIGMAENAAKLVTTEK